MGQKEEPSMEEILSSIKRIIAEDNELPAPRRARAEPEPELRAEPEPEFESEPDVLELTQPVDEPEEEPELEREPEPEPEPESISAEEAPALAEAPVAPVGHHAQSPEPIREEVEALLSASTEEATRQALAHLSRMIVRPEDPAADNTLEGLVRELLRPMLKEWLDANLPRIVQSTVDREVARISGR